MSAAKTGDLAALTRRRYRSSLDLSHLTKSESENMAIDGRGGFRVTAALPLAGFL